MTVERQSMQVDIVCVGFGPAMGGFLSTLSRSMTDENGQPLESSVAPGMPLQVVCYERVDDISFGVSGVATRGRGLRDEQPGHIHVSLSTVPRQIFKDSLSATQGRVLADRAEELRGLLEE